MTRTRAARKISGRTTRRPRRGGQSRTPAAVAAGPREHLAAVVEGLVAYEGLDPDERQGVQQLLTGDLTHLQQWMEVRAPGKPWLAVALGFACAAVADLRVEL